MEFLSLLCHLLIIGLSAALPLYTGGTYFKLGDTKYILFRNLTCFCLGLWLAAGIYEAVRSLVLRRRERFGDGQNPERDFRAALKQEPGLDSRHIRGLSAVDIWMLCYGAGVILSALFSRYRETAWLGYNEWYMGALSQLLFVGIYFLVSRCYDGKQYSLLLGGMAAFVVFMLGMCHRLGLDPTGLMRSFSIKDWEYSHMLSTIGNINWFCGYCSVALVFPVTAFLKGSSRRMRLAAYITSVMGLTLLLIQGSDIGIILVAVCLFVCMLAGVGDGKVLRGTVALGTGTAFLLPLYGLLAELLGERAWWAMPADGFGRMLTYWRGWWLIGLLGAGLYILLGRLLREEKRQRIVRRVAIAAAVALVLAGASGVLVFALKGSFDGGWGNGRGELWKLTLRGFGQNGILQKLLGVGPDCFAEYMYSAFAAGTLPALEGRWAGTVFANAHNEWLNHLLNLGLAGTVCYLGIFVSGLRRYRRFLPGILALMLYGTVSLTGFQQVLSTPLFFMTLGIAENLARGIKYPAAS
ncbi:MAG: O-antigen ligase family protein [Butyrivibrio sp.]|nr:O-antigen ligase family protein [Acetatifactor muris]MCM1560984.1 O-antigen ligase family protein [Butyrivibrio sp.]